MIWGKQEHETVAGGSLLSCPALVARPMACRLSEHSHDFNRAVSSPFPFAECVQITHGMPAYAPTAAVDTL